jgi:hypothetical protein
MILKLQKRGLAFLLILLSIAGVQQVKAQCVNTFSQWPTNTISNFTYSYQVAATNVYAGDYSVFSVIAGNKYQFSLCAIDGGGATIPYDSEITLFNASDPSSAIGYADDSCGSDARISWTATFTGLVNVQVNEFNCLTNQVNTTLLYRQLQNTPANDECSSAITLSVNTSCFGTAGTLTNATGSFPTTTCTGTNTDDVWFRVTSNNTNDLDITCSPNGAGFDPVMEVFTGNTCGSMVSLGCVDNGVDAEAEGVNLLAPTTGQIFYVRIFDYYTALAANPNFTICAVQQPLSGGPSNNECAGATNLSIGTVCNTVTGTLLGATASSPLTSCGGTNTDDVWYRATATDVGVTFGIIPNGTIDAVIEIYEGSCAALIPIGCVDATVGGEIEGVDVTGITPGTVVYYRVYDYGAGVAVDPTFGACALWETVVTAPNDECVGATTVIAGTTCGITTSSFANSTVSSPLTGCAGTNGGDVWFQVFSSDTAMTVELSGLDVTADLVVELFVTATVGDCNSLLSIGCADFTGAGATEGIDITNITAGQDIFMRVFNYNGTIPADPTINICAYWNPASLVPTNDECVGAIPLAPGASCIGTSGNVANATGSLPSSSCSAGGLVQADVWYSFVATASSVDITVDPVTTMDPVIQYFSGSCGALVSRGCSDFFLSSGTEHLTATGLTVGLTYFIRVFDYAGLGATATDFGICVRNLASPINNNCSGAAAVTLSPTTTFLPYTTALATQSQEGCNGNANDDVWFSFVAGQNPQGTTINVGGDLDFSTVVEVFSGSCAALTSIGCINNDVVGPYDLENIVLTTLTPGQTYFVRVYDVDASTTNSTFYLSIEGTPVGCNLTAPSITAAGSTVICGGNSITLNAPTVAGLTYQWQLNGGNLIGQTSNTIQAASAGSYSLFVVNGSGCTATSNAITVTSAVSPTVSISSASTTICGTGSISISTTAQAGSTYQWRRDDLNISGATNAAYSATQAGLYTLVLTNSSGCSATSNSIDIDQVSSLTASIGASGNTTICQGSSSILSINTEAGNAIQWKLNNNNISGATGSTYTATAAGTYTAVVTNGPTCSATSNTIVLTVVAGPTASINAAGSTTFCAGGSVNLNVTPVSGATYQWLQGGSPVFGAFGTSYSATEAGSYAVLVSTIACAATSNSVTVTVNQAPAASITANGPTTFCQGNTVVLSAPTGTGYSYQWLNNANPIAGATSANYTANASGNYVVTVTASGCSGNSPAVTVNVTPPPSSNITVNGNATVCQGNVVTLNAPVGNGLTYQWSQNGTPINGATSLNYTANASGNYTVTVSQGANCSSTSPATNVNIIAAPSAIITPAGSTSICQGSSVVLNANTGAGLTYQWQIGGATIANATQSSYTANAVGNYTVVVTNTGACTTTSTAVQVTVNPAPVATITPNGPTTFCIGGTVLLQASSGNGFTYQWLNNGNTIPGVVNNVFNVSQSGNYSVVVTDQNTCTATSSAINVNVAGIQAEITYTGQPAICDGNALLLDANQGVGLSYQWQNNGTGISGATQASYSATSAGNYTVIVTDPNNCVSTSTPVSVSVGNTPEVPIISPDGPPIFCQGDDVNLNYTQIAGITYSWSSEGSPVIGGTQGSLNVQLSGNYILKATNASNCAAFSEAQVVVVNPLPIVDLVLSPEEICNKQTTATLSGGSPLGGVYSGNGVNLGIFTSGDLTGNVDITYSYTDVNGCSGQAVDVIKVIDCTSIDNVANNAIQLYPNPAMDYIMLELSIGNELGTVQVLDATGRLVDVRMQAFGSNRMMIHINELAAGSYQVVIRRNGNSIVKRFVKTV